MMVDPAQSRRSRIGHFLLARGDYPAIVANGRQCDCDASLNHGYLIAEKAKVNYTFPGSYIYVTAER